MKRRVARYLVGSACPTCDGKRLKRAALAVTFAGLDIGTLSRHAAERPAGRARAGGRRSVRRRCRRRTWSIDRPRSRTRARRVAAGGSAHRAAPDVRRTPNLSEEKRIAAQRIARDVLERVTTLTDLGLGYLVARARHADAVARASCSGCAWPRRSARTCSAWSTCSTSRRPGCIRPTARRCCVALERLKRAGNSLFVVEHDLDVMRRADWLVDVGPRRRRAGRPRAVQRSAGRPARRRGVAHRALPVRRPRRCAAIAPACRARLARRSPASRATTCAT